MMMYAAMAGLLIGGFGFMFNLPLWFTLILSAAAGLYLGWKDVSRGPKG